MGLHTTLQAPWVVPTIPSCENTIVPRHSDCWFDIVPAAGSFFVIDGVTADAIAEHAQQELWRLECNGAKRDGQPIVRKNSDRSIKWSPYNKLTRNHMALVPRPACGDALIAHNLDQGWVIERRLANDGHKPTFLTYLPSGCHVLVHKAKNAKILAHACYPNPPEGLKPVLDWVG
ncbi:hypothetical protein FHS77_001196 [Paenochrobactrum gallinarii]|uniref:Uncharacterized protein n=1 Tax=Paenochrobactrum gallinarii TaxID=643673 RepID=A0A841LVU3_9HYPH|nr:hypothetical protein [Paenochrobactrum gallinarii]